MFTSIFHAGTFSVTNVLTALGVSALLGLIIAAVCWKTGSWPSEFTVMLGVMPVLICFVIMIVNGNLGASVAVLGAFGLVRFRSAPGTAREIGFLFFAMAAGLAAGMGFLAMAFLIKVLVSVLYIALLKSGFGQGFSGRRQLKITIPEDMNYAGAFDDLFLKYTKNAVLESVRTVNLGTMYELVYRVDLRKADGEKELIDGLRCRNGNLTISMNMVQKVRNEF